MKDKKRDKRVRDRDPSWEGSRNRGSFQTPGDPLTGRSGEVFFFFFLFVVNFVIH